MREPDRSPIALTEERGFSFDVNELSDLITDRTRLLIINSPQNPTSGIIPPEDLKAIAEIVVDKGIPVLADEIYSRILYEGAFHSISVYEGMADQTIILDGFSKTYAMTGWRIGYGVMPRSLAEEFGLLMVNSNSCTASFTQRAALAALQGPQDDVSAMVAEFRRRRDIFVAGLREIPGIRCPLPGGAFYLFPNIADLGLSSQEFADFLLYEGNVAGLSGHGFGAHGEGHLRFSYANSVQNIRTALDRIADCVRKIRG